MRSFDEIIGEWPVRPVHQGLLAFPARLLAGLPRPVRIDVVDAAGRHLVIATGEDEATRARAGGEDVIDGEEWTALAIAAESDRCFAPDLVLLLGTRGPGRITLALALDGAHPDPPRGWSVGTVLARLGLEPRSALGCGTAANGRPEERRAA